MGAFGIKHLILTFLEKIADVAFFLEETQVPHCKSHICAKAQQTIGNGDMDDTWLYLYKHGRE